MSRASRLRSWLGWVSLALSPSYNSLMLTTMRIGGLDIIGVSDGTLKTSLDNLLDMERARGEALVGATDAGSFFIPVNSFVVRRDGHTILIDAGAGNTMQPT